MTGPLSGTRVTHTYRDGQKVSGRYAPLLRSGFWADQGSGWRISRWRQPRSIPDSVLADPDVHERGKSGEQITELLDIVPAKLFIRRIVRPKFRNKKQRELPPVVAPDRSRP